MSDASLKFVTVTFKIRSRSGWRASKASGPGPHGKSYFTRDDESSSQNNAQACRHVRKGAVQWADGDVGGGVTLAWLRSSK